MKATRFRRSAALIGAVIIGLGLAAASLERVLLKARVQFCIFVSDDEKFKGEFHETASSHMIKDIISPENNLIRYYMITGKSGIGKSAAAKHNASLLGHKGIVHISVPADGDPQKFESLLAKRLHLYHLVCSIASIITGDALNLTKIYANAKASCISVILDTLCVLSRQYKRWHGGRSIVLVIDQVDNFLNDEKGMTYLEELQDIAKYPDICLMYLIFTIYFALIS